MRVTERLIRDTRNQKRKRAGIIEEEETLTYRKRNTQMLINDNDGVFANRKFDGINTQKSIFDKTAVFHTKQQ